MAMYIVAGVDKETGKDRQVAVNANTEGEAAKVAAARGVAVLPNGVRLSQTEKAGPRARAELEEERARLGGERAQPLGYRGVRKAIAQVVLAGWLVAGGGAIALINDGGNQGAFGFGIVLALIGLFWLIAMAVGRSD